jgi:hypothetical protein
MRMKDLVADQRAAYKSLRSSYVAMDLHFKMERNKNRILYHMRASALAKKQAEEKVVLRQKHVDDRARAKAEKAFLAPSKLEPDFWTDHPNYDGRRDTMAAVLKSLGMPVENVDELMPAYAAWLLTTEHGRKCRWALMTAFVTERTTAFSQI